MFRIAICDDVPVYVERLSGYIEEWARQRQVALQLGKFASGEEILFEQEYAGDFTAVFMDIELSGMDGMEAAVKIRKRNRFVSIVFVSQYEKYFKQMFRIYPFQYIEKPVSRQKVFEALDRVVREHKLFYESYMFSFNRRNYIIPLWGALYFMSEKRRVRILMENGHEYFTYEKLDEVEKSLVGYNNHFVRIHQSYLVNCRMIEQYDSGHVIMRNGEILPVSRKGKERVMQMHMDFLAEKCQ